MRLFPIMTTALLLLLPLGLSADDAKAPPPNTLTDQEKKDGWKLLFDGQSLEGWRRFKKKDAEGWAVKDGALVLEKTGAGDLMTVDQYGDFEFSIDWKFESGNNSGIIYRCTEEGGTSYTTGPEMQVAMQQPGGKIGKTGGGSLYDMYEPNSNPFKPGEWTTFKIVCKGKHIEQWVNGVKVVDCDIGSEDWNTRLAASKWKNVKLFASQPKGHIALQDHGAKLAFRNIKIRPLDK